MARPAARLPMWCALAALGMSLALASCRARDGAAADSAASIDRIPATGASVASSPASDSTPVAPVAAPVETPASPRPGDRPSRAGMPVATHDTVRGTVVETGSAPNTMLQLQPRSGNPITLGGPSLPLLRRVVGLEVMVEGLRTAERAPVPTPGDARIFSAERFTVRAADGVAAHDGIVTVVAGQYWLALADGRTLEVRALPAELKTKPGARVFLAGPLDRAPAAYGIIREAR